LNNSQYFLFNYGAELGLMKRYDESIRILKEAESRLNDADFYIYLGNSYENIGLNKDAELCYLKATYIMPAKFLSKVKLVSLFMRTGRQKEAIEIAKEIVSMKVKVPSPIVDQIRHNMLQLVNSSSIN
jgi:tetratricopeptide (TPR) repeat protein